MSDRQHYLTRVARGFSYDFAQHGITMPFSGLCCE